MALKFYGSSDDLIEVDGHIREEFYANGDDQASFRVLDPANHGMTVTMAYGESGTWTATCGMLDEGAMIPWPVTLNTHRAVNNYTVVLDIDCPDDVVVVRTDKDKDDAS